MREAVFRPGPGINNAFWVVTKGYEIDIAELHYPGDLGISLHNWTTGFGQLGRLQEGAEG